MKCSGSEKKLRNKPCEPSHLRRSQPRSKKIFLNNSSHPWAQRAAEFVEQHKADTILSAELPNGYHVIFYPKARKGLWYKFGTRLEGVGMLQPTALEKLCAIAQEKGLA